jgi:hypothetical protein
MQRPIPVTMNIMLRPLYHTTLVVEFHTLQTVCLESDLKLYIFALGGKYCTTYNTGCTSPQFDLEE